MIIPIVIGLAAINGFFVTQGIYSVTHSIVLEIIVGIPITLIMGFLTGIGASFLRDRK